MLFLVTGTISKHEYMEDKVGRRVETRLVEAEDAAGAELKFETHFQRDDPYGTSYNVDECTAYPPII